MKKSTATKKDITNIVEETRRMFGITRDEYALCAYVQFRIADPRNKKPGWCCDTKENIAEFIGITRAGLYKMIDKMERFELLEVDSVTSFVRVTENWMDAKTGCKQSLHNNANDSVNKVDAECKQSLHNSVNKVTHNIEVKEDISKDERENARAKKSLPLKEEEKKEGKEPAAGPSPESVVYTHDPAELEMLLRGYYQARPADWQAIKERLDRAAAQFGIKYDFNKTSEVVTRYCEWTITKGNTAWTFSRHHSRLRTWMADQPSKEVKPQTNVSTTEPTGPAYQRFTR